MQSNKFDILLLQLFTLTSLLITLSYSHYNPPPSTSTTQWDTARATYYATADPRDTVGGACGYGDLDAAGYGKATAGLSAALFDKGQTCGACFELRCVEDLRNCIPGTSIIVTATNYCAPNLGFSADEGGKCNSPNKHFVLPIEAFEKIALWKAGNMAVQFRRIKCRKEGGIRFAIDGSGAFISVLISNVAGAGDMIGVKIKGSLTGWLPMSRSWGQNWIINAELKKQPLSFEVTTSDRATLISYNVAPKTWDFGQSFEGKQFD
ncbi:expansin-A13 [Silene latifolia]|uniref:expansin-A13 n=1 Tax=Silene latifolia TaxID=37657 RepID=UPI003D77FCA3